MVSNGWGLRSVVEERQELLALLVSERETAGGWWNRTRGLVSTVPRTLSKLGIASAYWIAMDAITTINGVAFFSTMNTLERLLGWARSNLSVVDSC